MAKIKVNSFNFSKALTVLVVLSALYGVDAFADGPKNIGEIATNVTQSFKGIGQLILATAFVAGIGFVMAAIFKFKQHKDNPTQIPLGTPIALLAVGVALVFLPNIIAPAGSSLFGGPVQSGGFEGEGTTALPK